MVDGKVSNPPRVLLTTLVANMVWTVASGCGEGPQHTVANYCVAVAAHKESEIEDVSERLDSFGARHHLTPDKSNPALYVYRRGNDEIEIHLLTGMGPHGAVLAFFRFQPGAGEEVLDDLQRFTSQELANHYAVTSCSSIANFAIPEAWR